MSDKNQFRTLSVFCCGAMLALLCNGASARAQSTDPKAPTPLTGSEISGGEVEERASYYFSFDGGPGEVTAVLEAKMKKGAKSGSVGVELFDANSKSIASAVINGGLDAGLDAGKEKLENELAKQLAKITSAADSIGGGDTKQKTARVKVKTQQPLVLKLTVDKGVESFTLRMGGAFGAAAEVATGETAPIDPSQSAPTGEAPVTASDPTQQTTPTEQPTSTGESVPPANEPKLIVPGKKPAFVKIPANKASGQKPAVVIIPKKQP